MGYGTFNTDYVMMRVARMGEERGMYSVLVGKSEGRRTTGET